ncbi:MAG: DUF4012 domain-containing protein [Patescibacteria group bacterium]|nr:DUF4012 domain-containing protein [Patescibacteria group bacterium]
MAQQLDKSLNLTMDAAGIGVIRWLFEFALSIPLGFLLAFTVLLSLVEAGSSGATKAAKALATGASWTIGHLFFAAIAIAKGVFVIPLKLATLLIAAVYRAISASGTFGVVAITAVYEGVKNYASVFSRPPKHLYRKLAAIACVAIVVMLPVKFLETAPDQISILKGSVLGATRDGYSDIASFNLASAQANFLEARESLDSLNAGMRAMVEVLPAGKDGLHASSAGESLSLAGAYISQGLAAPQGEEGGAPPSAVAMLARLSDSLRLSLPHLTAAQASLTSINPGSVPPEFRDKFAAAASSLPRVNAAVSDSISLSKTLLSLLGGEGPRRYAVLFQNNNELRPAGGLIGSLAFVDIEDGKVANIEVPGGGPYDFQGYLSEHIKAPKPLSLINARWELQDANWYPDWPTSAAKVAWFLEHAGYSSVDGVIAVQATTLEKLLAVTGPIDFPEYGVTLTNENVLKEIQRQVELEYDLEENKPKAYIGELLPRVMEKLLAQNSGDLIATLGLVKSEIREKNILVHFRDEDSNKAFARRGWQPSIADASTDYLSIIHANIGGGKTDGVISESREQEITINSDGSVTAELTIIRAHNGDPADPFEGVNNVDYVRVYVPEGSELISFEGTKAPASNLFETPQVYFRDDEELAKIEGRVVIDEATGTRITQEFGKTVFGNWLQVNPGNVVVAKIKYRLPFTIQPYDVFNPNIKNGYSLIAQKQAGARDIPYSVSLRYPSDWLVGWNKAVGSGEVSVLGPGLTVFEGVLNEDAAFAVSFED